jgi:hypothetical protein
MDRNLRDVPPFVSDRVDQGCSEIWRVDSQQTMRGKSIQPVRSHGAMVVAG